MQHEPPKSIFRIKLDTASESCRVLSVEIVMAYTLPNAAFVPLLSKEMLVTIKALLEIMRMAELLPSLTYRTPFESAVIPCGLLNRAIEVAAPSTYPDVVAPATRLVAPEKN